MDEVGLARVLQKARKHAGLTQQQLCEQADISYSTLAKIERGAIKAPSIFTIYNIAHALGLNLDELLADITPTRTSDSKKQSKSGIKFVFFDINGCMVRFFHRAFTRLAEDTGANASVIETAFWHYNDVVCRGEMTMADFNIALADRLGVTDINWEKYYLSAVEPIQEMREVAAWASQHYQVGLLSNIMPGFIDDMLKSDLLPSLSYDVVIDSSVVGAIKPEAEIYGIAQSKAGIDASEILLVDDSRTNLMAAERAGWQVMWFDDYRPDESVARIREALEY